MSKGPQEEGFYSRRQAPEPNQWKVNTLELIYKHLVDVHIRKPIVFYSFSFVVHLEPSWVLSCLGGPLVVPWLPWWSLGGSLVVPWLSLGCPLVALVLHWWSLGGPYGGLV